MRVRATAWTATALLVLLGLAVPADAEGQCRMEATVQYDLEHNEHTCTGGCEFTVVVQVGMENSTSCNDVCRFNVFVQVGLGSNSLRCGGLPSLLEKAVADPAVALQT